MKAESINIKEIFGSYVFNQSAMEKFVPADALKEYRNCLKLGKSLNIETADAIAEGMKNWAISKGATHYTHWFQPLTGETAEKHEGFIEPTSNGNIIMKFSGKELIKGEPDASSFPSGGLRATFEARGYSAWDPTSNAFIKDSSLCIPTVFFSYSEEALDNKAPLLRSINALDKQALRILRLFGDKKTHKVIPMVGAEQEYFLIDKNLFMKREDLRICGRTLFGSKPPKTQELDDHYYGTIKPRVKAFMRELDKQLWQVGVLAKTEHNEVAPSQHEMAPVYTDCNNATDQNQLTMDIMKKVADSQDLVCLLNEKPFAGVNGSGKHNNWSLSTDTGKNLFSPGKTPSQNAQFLLFLAAFTNAVDNYQELLRCSVSFAGNDNRLGAQEAPPAVISLFIGSELKSIVDSIVNDRNYMDIERKPIRIGIDVMPSIPKDTSDRNRTSPIAFTGNKFEFRMLGSSQSISGPNTVLNTIMAKELSVAADKLEKAKDFNKELHDFIKESFVNHGRIIFNGNGYEQSWIKEAAERGLANLPDTSKALPTYMSEKNIELFTSMNVLSKQEMLARNAINFDNYCKIVSIEANTIIDMAQKEIIPAISKCEGILSQTIINKKQAISSISTDLESSLCVRLSEDNSRIYALVRELRDSLSQAPCVFNDEALAYYHDNVSAITNRLRTVIDDAESLIPSEYWPYPTYSELLFSERI